MLKRLFVVLAMTVGSAGLDAQDRPLQIVTEPGSTTYLVFFRQRPVGREEVTVVRNAEGWTVRGTSQLGGPIDITTRRAEVRYDVDWKPLSLIVDSIASGQDMQLRTTFANGIASNELVTQGTTTPKDIPVSADAVVLPNTFLGSYAALAHRLQGLKPGAELRAYIAPQIEVPIRVAETASETIETPRETIPATRLSLKVVNPPPAPELDMTVWVDANGGLLRLSIPSQMLELAREDIASAGTRTAAFSIPGDERVSIPATGFILAGTLTRSPSATGRLPAVVLIGGSGPTDRDETVFGIPVFGHLARGLVEAGFLVVRYDKRGVGQSGGRVESVTLSDYAEDARSVVRWLERRPEVDKDRIAIVGHSEGAAVAMLLASREKRVKAAALDRRPRHHRGGAGAGTAAARAGSAEAGRVGTGDEDCAAGTDSRRRAEGHRLGGRARRHAPRGRHAVVPEPADVRPREGDEGRRSAAADRAGRARHAGAAAPRRQAAGAGAGAQEEGGRPAAEGAGDQSPAGAGEDR